MRVIIVGCGRVGSSLARDLSQDGHDVTIIDRSPTAFSRASERGVLGPSFTGNQVIGDGTDIEVLRRAGIDGSDLFMALTEGDNRNLMAAQIAQTVFGVKRVICRVNDPIRDEVYEHLGLKTISPTILQTDAIKRFIQEG